MIKQEKQQIKATENSPMNIMIFISEKQQFN
jgi:hypothetical protein